MATDPHDDPHDIDEQEDDEAPRRLACPKCGSTDVRRSRTDSFVGYFNSMLGRRPYRCRSCRVKFYRHGEAQHQN